MFPSGKYVGTRARLTAIAAVLMLTPLAPVGAAAPGGAVGQTPPVIGVVRDTAGAPLPNVQVVLSSLNRVTTTNDAGEFTFRSLPAGRHHITTLLLGYAPGHADVTVPPTGTDAIRVVVRMKGTTLTLSAVQVTATPTGTDPRHIAQSTVEVSGQDLARKVSATVAQSLSNEPGVSVRFQGAAASPVIRGMSGERILVLQDGQRAGDLSASSPDHAVSIDPLAAQRIEVVRGPASLLYGNNALGGVVNVISNDIPTAIPSHHEGYIAAQTETANPGAAVSAGLTLPAGELVAFVGRLSGRSTGDMRQGGNLVLPNTYSKNLSGVLGLGAVGSRANGGLVYRGYGFDYGLPSADNDGITIRGHRHEANGHAEKNFITGPFSSARASGTAQWYTHDEVEGNGEIGTTFNLETQTLDLLGRTNAGRASGAIGTSLLRKQYAATGEEALTPGANSTGAGAFVYQEFRLQPSEDPDARVARLQVGARYDLYRIVSLTGDPKFGPGRSLDFNNVSGSLGLTLPVGGLVSVGGSVARAFRAPTVEELYSNAVHEAAGTFDRGNPALEAENNHGVDGILRLDGARVHAQFAAYYNSVRNYITPNIVRDTVIVANDGSTETLPLNEYSQADAILQGVEGRIEAEVARRLVLGAMGDVTRGRLHGGARNGEPLPFMPAPRIGGLARYDNGVFSLEGEVRHVFEQSRVPAPAIADDPSVVATGAYDLVNFSLGWNLSAGHLVHAITLRADNLLDKQYREATSRIKNFAFNPGRSFSLVYKMLF